VEGRRALTEEGKGRKIEASLQHVDELYAKYRNTQLKLDRQRDEQVEAKRRKLKHRIDAKIPKIDQFSDYLTGQRFDHYDVVEKYLNSKGEEVVLKPPLKKREKRSKEKLIGSRSKSRVLRQDYMNYLNESGERTFDAKGGQYWMSADSSEKQPRRGPKKGTTKGLKKVYDFGREVKDSDSDSSNSEGESPVTIRVKRKDKKIVYRNYSGKNPQNDSSVDSMEGELYLSGSRGQRKDETSINNKENANVGNSKIRWEPGHGKEAAEKTCTGEAEALIGLKKGSGRLENKDEGSSPEPPTDQVVVDPHRVDYLAEFLIGDKNKKKFKMAVNKVKITGLLCRGYQPTPSEPKVTEEDSNPLPTPDESKVEPEEERNRTPKLGIGTLMNLKSKMKSKVEEARNASKERLLIDRLPEPGMKKKRILTNGQPLSNFNQEQVEPEKPRKIHPSLQAADIIEAKKRRDAEIRKQKEFEALQREMFKEYFAEEEAEEEKRVAGEKAKEKELAEKKRKEGLDQKARLEETRIRLKEENERRKKTEEENRKQALQAKLNPPTDAKKGLLGPQTHEESDRIAKESLEDANGAKQTGLETGELVVKVSAEDRRSGEEKAPVSENIDVEPGKDRENEEGVPSLPLVESETIELIVSRVAVDSQGNLVGLPSPKEMNSEILSKRSSRIMSDLTLPLEDGICIIEEIGEDGPEAAIPQDGFSRKDTEGSQTHRKLPPIDVQSKVEEPLVETETLTVDQVDLEELNRLLDIQIARVSAEKEEGGLDGGSQEGGKHPIPVVEVDLSEGREAGQEHRPSSNGGLLSLPVDA
jgi:hypothetical protein